MDAGLLSIGLAFIEGLALIISPCILPILPIILSGSLTGNKNKPLGIIIGFITTFSIFTLFIRSLVAITHTSPDIIRNIALFILLSLGIIMMSGYLTEKFTLLTQKLISVGDKLLPSSNEKSGFWNGVLFGALIGIVWTPCAGPIFAAVAVQVAIQKTSLSSVLTLFSFSLGVGLPMLLIAYTGNRIISRLSIIKHHAGAFRKIMGAIIILSVAFLYFPSTFSLAQGNIQKNELTGSELINGLEKSYEEPKIAGIENWINSPALELSTLKGKVVLIDFWTYSCINCIRTLPYLKDWYKKYHNDGLVIIGIHSPEFEFEKNLTNVRNAVANFGILYPVAMDNQFVTWQNFNNSYWPAHYLIDKEGKVVYTHFGEGEYDVTENNIRHLLGIGGAATPLTSTAKTTKLTPEIYLGYAREAQNENLEPKIQNMPSDYNYPIRLDDNSWALKGKWTIESERIISNSIDASIKLHFYAKNVFAVLSTTGLPVTIEIKLDGQPVKTMVIAEPQLYTLLKQKSPQKGMLEIISKNEGLQMYTFTFGNAD